MLLMEEVDDSEQLSGLLNKGINVKNYQKLLCEFSIELFSFIRQDSDFY